MVRNIPFLDIDDPAIQAVYYYRWKVFKAHVREIGPEGTTVLEFLDNVPWARQPFTDLNDSASFHILEGRWLRDPSIIDSLIDHLYSGGANDRHFSESIAAATESRTRVTGDPSPRLKHLAEMRAIYDQWDDHFDRERGLYWIEPLLDATEYTIASIDASGAGFTAQASSDQNHYGFTGGFVFRPSINSYQYANALAIARFAALGADPDLAADYTRKAAELRAAVLSQLWNPALNHFVDRYQRSTAHVTAGEFIRGRELVGFVPWAFELPPTGAEPNAQYDRAWTHVLASIEFAGAYRLRTVEPSYPRYLTQYRYDKASGLPECQ
ncbi:MAG: alpha,alpha-trehalase [Pseudomonadota bacterium]|nr:alpha,alpha-trehalase [Pseudomonadota bacterium]